MPDLFGKIILTEALKKVIGRISDLMKSGVVQQEERERLSAALKSIQIASTKTQNFIGANGYEPNEELSMLWIDALEKCINANMNNLPEYLFNKAKFWGNPQDWLNQRETLQLVPDLKFLNDECRMLLVKLARD